MPLLPYFTIRPWIPHPLRLAIAIILCLACASCLPTRVDQATIVSCRDPLASVQAMPPHLRLSFKYDALVHFYTISSSGCAWSKANERALLVVLDDAPAQGFGPDEFHMAAIRAEKNPELHDLLLTDAALRYAHAMRRGRVMPSNLARDVDITLPAYDPAQGLRSAFAANMLATWLRGLPPAQPRYTLLVDAYAHYRKLAAAGGWTTLEVPEKPVRPGEQSPLLSALEQRLIAEGDLVLPQTVSESDRLEGALLDALRHFQMRHGLAADGVLGEKTVAAMNVSAAARATQIALNLERWRVLSQAFDPTHFEVNVAAATATLYIDGTIALDMRAIVGAEDTPTPILRSDIDTVTINPSWVVPLSIVRKEILPAIRRQPDYLEKHDMRWQGMQLVQAPGPKNSLGRLKFEMPSAFAVYLHDTPSRRLFARDERALSHGCIRLEKPLDLAEILLNDNPDWARSRIEQAIDAGVTQRIPLNREMPVIVVYWTSFVDKDGTVQFRNDVYGRDARLMTVLASGEPVSAAQGTSVGACRA